MFLCWEISHIFAIKNEKQTIILVQAAPKTHPGGVQGALFKVRYQVSETAPPVKKPPIAKAAKLMSKKITSRIYMLRL